MVNTRERILNISFQLFLQKNYKEVTLKEIVEKTGMSKGAFYHYFESKEQVFLECTNFVISSAMDVYKKISKNSLLEFYHDFLNHNNLEMFFPASENKDFHYQLNIFSLFFEGAKLFPSFQEKLVEITQMELNVWKEIVQLARQKGEIKSVMSDEQIAKMFLYSADGAGMHSIFSKGSIQQAQSSILQLWDSFYEEIKC
ncbi:MAG: TetR/AcrR family transcriptional regulator [Bacillota bacterium]|nr:TetR/AcrR family transcriptional regulator [Bacillota bacterium]